MDTLDLQAAQAAVLHLLQPGERVELNLDAQGAEMRVTDRRILVTADGVVRLDIAHDELRRIQFDIEALRPATMVIVPHQARWEPQVLAIPRGGFHHAGEVLAFIGERMP